MDLNKIYEAKHYKDLFKDYVKKGLYYKKFYDYYSEEDIVEAGKYLKKEYDFDYNYTTMMMYKRRYLLNPNKKVFELPQEMYMSVALFLAIPEEKENRLLFAKKIYDACAT
jgi:ribonucleoside-diphosphate reductase alpha chain